MGVSIEVNGRSIDVDADPATPLLWVLRDHLGMIGTKFGCGIAQCGACTVHCRGPADPLLSISAVRRRRQEDHYHRGADARIPAILCSRPGSTMNVPQCGYCQSGMLMAAAALLKQIPKPTDADIDQYVTNICRCGTYPRVRAAIHKAADLQAQRSRV